MYSLYRVTPNIIQIFCQVFHEINEKKMLIHETDKPGKHGS